MQSLGGSGPAVPPSSLSEAPQEPGSTGFDSPGGELATSLLGMTPFVREAPPPQRQQLEAADELAVTRRVVRAVLSAGPQLTALRPTGVGSSGFQQRYALEARSCAAFEPLRAHWKGPIGRLRCGKEARRRPPPTLRCSTSR